MVSSIILYDTPEKLEIAEILDNSLLGAYNESVNSSYNSANARITLSKSYTLEEELTNFNPFMLVHLQNSGLLPIEARLATRTDLEEALRFGLFGLGPSGNPVYFGLALRRIENINIVLADRLVNQLKERGIKINEGKFNEGKLIPFNALELSEEKDFSLGLVFNLNDNATKESILDLNSFKWDYVRPKGLTCAYFDGKGNWNSINWHLDKSCGNDRVVIVKTPEPIYTIYS